MCDREIMRIKEAAKLLRVCDTTVRRLLDNGVLEGFKIPSPYGRPGHRRLYKDSVIKLMQKQGFPTKSLIPNQTGKE